MIAIETSAVGVNNNSVPYQNLSYNLIIEEFYKVNLESRLIEIINTKGYVTEEEVLLIANDISLFDELKLRRVLSIVLNENNLKKLKVNNAKIKVNNIKANNSRYIIIKGFEEEIKKLCAWDKKIFETCYSI